MMHSGEMCDAFLNGGIGETVKLSSDLKNPTTAMRFFKGGKNEYIWTGVYTVAYFGTDDSPSVRPYFLMHGASGDVGHFTCSLYKASTYRTRISAELALDKENERLEAMGHWLAGRLSVLEIYAKKAEAPND